MQPTVFKIYKTINHRVYTCAIPAPIKPLPMTVTFLTAEARSEDVLKQDPIAGANALFSNTNCLLAPKESIAIFSRVFTKYFERKLLLNSPNYPRLKLLNL